MFANGLTTGVLATLLAGGHLAAAHMEIQYPAPFRSKFNPNAVNIDYTNTAPLASDGSNYPCKGYQSDLGTPAGKPTATFAPGGTYNFTVVGGAPHGGGSCQVSLSYDKGKTFTVIQSIEGGCPLSSNYDFTIPSDAPQGEAIWAWTWNNEIGNREFYMNCAAVTIGGSSSKREADEVEKRASSTPFSQRPPVFVANLNNGCTVAEGVDVEYPNPGPDVVKSGSKLGPPQGNCGATSSSGSGSGSSSGSGSGSSSGSGSGSGTSAPSSAAPATTAAASPAASSSLPGGVFVTVPSQAATSTTAAAAAPTTLVVSTVASSASAPIATGTTGSGSGSGSSGSSAGGFAPGTACSNEGQWNCINGTTFQRCASGVWSAVQAVAPGTSCTAGQSDSFSVKAAASRRHARFRASAKLRLAA
ncbi:uncharacterized protein THITE_2124610 [Thermothielavioides terrestris NRRL 8126]|uniref:Lytic polysaccharide monooxygenase n=1 Tax=Thermothielavioides terrestris (strain ATCC 38088 / NRRL 8126) TaxID=578455 RepID=G2RG22_THETT|nr:uncharacterized protein THITE_2124610 [Thermothielavioides terrestris NRRL 8126]AEO71776.1 hypothetical protein THITE_2124610 [Thermothielavioides terrestris NRRL 8126]